MIFDFAETSCILEVLKALSSRKIKYSDMFRLTKVSHTTLQSVLRELIKKDFILKYNLGHQNVDYQISNKGRKLLKVLILLKELVD